jgi:hypothetical protein
MRNVPVKDQVSMRAVRNGKNYSEDPITLFNESQVYKWFTTYHSNTGKPDYGCICRCQRAWQISTPRMIRKIDEHQP